MGKKYIISPTTGTDNRISNLLGVPSGFSVSIFFLLTLALDTAKINYLSIVHGNIAFNGDLSLLYLVTFIITSSILIVIQHNLREKDSKTDNIV